MIVHESLVGAAAKLKSTQIDSRCPIEKKYNFFRKETLAYTVLEGALDC